MSAVFAGIEGTRPVLVEMQALVAARDAAEQQSGDLAGEIVRGVLEEGGSHEAHR